jgi:hypothetical protein
MAMEEHPERYGWWINELESLGLSVKKINEFNDLNEIRDLGEIIKLDKNIDYNTYYFSIPLQSFRLKLGLF